MSQGWQDSAAEGSREKCFSLLELCQKCAESIEGDGELLNRQEDSLMQRLLGVIPLSCFE